MRITKPLARSEDLVIEELEDEVLVYDAKNQQAHCLASAAAKVWRACDGTKDVPALAESLALSVDDVTRALETLDGVELLENQGLQIVTNGDGNGDGLTRRELGRRSAKVGAAAAAAPMLYSVAVPSPAAAQTPTNLRCALFSTNACGTSAGRRGHLGLLLLLPGGGDCKVGGSISTCSMSTCPDGVLPACALPPATRTARRRWPKLDAAALAIPLVAGARSQGVQTTKRLPLQRHHRRVQRQPPDRLRRRLAPRAARTAAPAAATRQLVRSVPAPAAEISQSTVQLVSRVALPPTAFRAATAARYPSRPAAGGGCHVQLLLPGPTRLVRDRSSTHPHPDARPWTYPDLSAPGPRGGRRHAALSSFRSR